MHTDQTTPDSPLDDVAFLARSRHRVRVLQTLASGPRLRVDIHDETDIPQPTLGRILGDFVDRNWIECRDREYALTPFGELVVEGFGALLDTVALVQSLGGVLSQLPTEEMDFDVREFRDAAVTTPEPGNVFAPVDRLTELFFGAERGRILVHSAPPGTEADHRNRARDFQESDRVLESINSAEVLDQTLADPERARLIRGGIESGRAEIYRYEGAIPLVLATADGTTLLAPTDEADVPTALVETRNETVRAWVETTLDDYRERSTRVTLADLPQ